MDLAQVDEQVKAIGPIGEEVDPQWTHLPDRVGATFEGQTVFVTGGTGLIGKVLLDKILRCCRGVKMIYMLVRPRKGKSGMERIDATFESPLFDLLKSDKSNDFRAKVRPICGDITAKDLGISPEDRKLLQEEVNIVYHSAANVRFDQAFKRIITMNVRGTKYMLDLAKEIQNLKLFVQVSTAYAHTHESVLEERMYDPPADPHHVLKIIEMLDEQEVETLAPQYMAGHPNSYGFSKSLSEGLVNEEIRRGTLPAIIVRPAIVMPIYKAPLPGWTDNINGPMGLLIGAGKGICRSILISAKDTAETIPVDISVNAICVATFAYLNHPEQRDDLSVINLTSSSWMRASWPDFIESGRRVGTTIVPFNWVPWYPGGTYTSSRIYHNLSFYFKQLLPAVLADAILWCFGIKAVATNIQKRISKGYGVLHYYTSNPFNFRSDKIQHFQYNILNEREAEIYYLDCRDFDFEKYVFAGTLGARRYLMRESDETLPRARKHVKTMYFVDKIFIAFICYLLFCAMCKLFTSMF